MVVGQSPQGDGAPAAEDTRTNPDHVTGDNNSRDEASEEEYCPDDLLEGELLLVKIRGSTSHLHRLPQQQEPYLSTKSTRFLQGSNPTDHDATATEDIVQDVWMLLEEHLRLTREEKSITQTVPQEEDKQNIVSYSGDKTSLLLESSFDTILTILEDQIYKSQTGIMQGMKLADEVHHADTAEKKSPTKMATTYNIKREYFSIVEDILAVLSAKFVLETQRHLNNVPDRTLPFSSSRFTLLVQDNPPHCSDEVSTSQFHLHNPSLESPQPVEQQHVMDGEMLLAKIRETAIRASSQQLGNSPNPALERDETLVDAWQLLEEKRRLVRVDNSLTRTGDEQVDKSELLLQTPYNELIALLADRIHQSNCEMKVLEGSDDKGKNNLDEVNTATPFDDILVLLKMKLAMDKPRILEEGNMNPPQLVESDGHGPSRLRHENSLPGAVRIEEIDSNPGMDMATNSHYDNTVTQSLRQMESGNNPLVEANIVDEGEVILAKPDPWWRRHQWWLAGAAVVVVVGISLVGALTTIDLQGNAPTMAPTSLFAGNLFDIQTLVTNSFPGANIAIEDDTTPQYEAFRWLGDVSFAEPEAYSNSRRILQQFSLATLFFSTNGATSWRRRDEWLNDTDECKWYGVRCLAGESLIVALTLSDNGMNGTIPSDLGILSNNLTHLNFSKNRLLGSIPTEVGLLSTLTSMMLQRNILTRPIPTEVGMLTNLEVLDLSENSLGSSLPTELGKLSDVSRLSVQRNQLIGPIPSELGTLTKLTNVDFRGNGLTFAIPSELGALTNLRIMNFRENAINRPIPSELGLIGELMSLDLASNLIFSTLPDEIGLLTSLTFLDISNNLITGTFPGAIESLSNLSWLGLGDNFFHSAIPYWLPVVLKDSITHLDLSLNEFRGSVNSLSSCEEDACLDGLSMFAMTNLVSLELYSRDTSVSSFDGVLDSEIEALTNLQVFDAHNCQIIGSIPTEIGRLSNLVVFNVGNTFLSGRIPTEIGLAIKLEVLDFSDSPIVSSIPPEIGRLDRLVFLSFGLTYMEGPITSELMSLTELTSLDLGFQGLTGALPNEISLLRKLTNLDLRSTNLSGTIPSGVASLVALERLILGGGYTGSIPSELWSHSSLKHLEYQNFYSSDLSATLPTEVGLMRQLTELKIIALNMEGSSIPSVLGSLRSLKILDFQSTNLSGTLPTEIGLLTNLQELVLKDNAFEGPLPSFLGNCHALQVLDIERNQLTGSVPTDIGMATLLTSLILRNTSVTGILPSELGLLSGLNSLDFENSQVSGALPSEIGLLNRIAKLNCASTFITSTIPTEVGLLANLESINFSSSGTFGTLPSEIGQLRYLLTSIDFSATRLSGSLPTEIGNLSRLVSIDLSYTPLTGSIPSEIGKLVLLENLNLKSTQLSGDIPTDIALLSGYQMFDLDASKLSGSIPESLYDFQCCSGTSPEDFTCTTIIVNCDAVSCSFCQCKVTDAPSFVPSTSVEPSTSLYPTLTPSISLHPSESMQPSQSMPPSSFGRCDAFTSIATSGKLLSISNCTNCSEVVLLPFTFKWAWAENIDLVTVSSNGFITMRNTSLALNDGNISDCCEAYPIEIGGASSIPRIAVAQGNLNPKLAGSIYTATTIDGSFIVSWENVSYSGSTSRLNFAVLLYFNGDIEFRWGNGTLPILSSVIAGVEQDDLSFAVPVSGRPFVKPNGVTSPGQWPTNQCRYFETSSDNILRTFGYIEKGGVAMPSY